MEEEIDSDEDVTSSKKRRTELDDEEQLLSKAFNPNSIRARSREDFDNEQIHRGNTEDMDEEEEEDFEVEKEQDVDDFAQMEDFRDNGVCH